MGVSSLPIPCESMVTMTPGDPIQALAPGETRILVAPEDDWPALLDAIRPHISAGEFDRARRFVRWRCGPASSSTGWTCAEP